MCSSDPVGHAVALLGFSLAAVLTGGCGGTGGSPTLPTPGPLTTSSVIVSGNNRLTAIGQTTQLSAQATMSDRSKRDITATASWQSRDPSVATVSQTGLVTAALHAGIGDGVTQDALIGGGCGI
jgi:Big-like domain-containing protein